MVKSCMILFLFLFWMNFAALAAHYCPNCFDKFLSALAEHAPEHPLRQALDVIKVNDSILEGFKAISELKPTQIMSDKDEETWEELKKTLTLYNLYDPHDIPTQISESMVEDVSALQESLKGIFTIIHSWQILNHISSSIEFNTQERAAAINGCKRLLNFPEVIAKNESRYAQGMSFLKFSDPEKDKKIVFWQLANPEQHRLMMQEHNRQKKRITQELEDLKKANFVFLSVPDFCPILDENNQKLIHAYMQIAKQFKSSPLHADCSIQQREAAFQLYKTGQKPLIPTTTYATVSLQDLQQEWSAVSEERNATWKIWNREVKSFKSEPACSAPSDLPWISYLSKSLDTIYVNAQKIIHRAHESVININLEQLRELSRSTQTEESEHIEKRANTLTVLKRDWESWLGPVIKLHLQNINEDLKKHTRDKIGSPGYLQNFIEKKIDFLKKERSSLMTMSATYN